MRTRRAVQGFTLIELTVTLTIIVLLLTMMVVPLSTQMDQRRETETQRQLELAREAVVGFAIARGRLPCPAPAATATGAAGAGLESRVGAACAAAEGVLPWVDLGVPEADAWGRRFTYRVTLGFGADPAGGMQASFLITTDGNITVTDGATNIALMVPAVIVSHGKNGLGAFQSSGVQIAGAAGDELLNANNDAVFVSRLNAPNFDDHVIWLSGNILKSRMVAAGRLP